MKVKARTEAERVKLGQEAFVITTTDGELERTMVGEVYTIGYRFLNGRSDGGGHWFQFDQALAASDALLKKCEADLRARLRAISRQRKYLQSPEYRDRVMTAPYHVIDLQQVEKRQRPLRLPSIKVPSEEYVHPGDFVYVVITPSTRIHYEVYRPHLHFVLQTKVLTVSFSADGVLHYNFTTPYVVEEFFHSKAKANHQCKKKVLEHLARFPESGNVETIPYVLHEEETEHLLEEDLPF